MPSIADNLAAIRKRINSAVARSSHHQEVHLVAVTKNQPVSSILEAIQAGVKIIGENRVQEALEKFPQIGQEVQWNLIGQVQNNKNLFPYVDTIPWIQWHLIGHLQKNKVKKALWLFDMIHSVDSLELAQEIDRQAQIIGKHPAILLQVNVSGEASKFGLSPDQVCAVAEQIQSLQHLKLSGLMTIPPLYDNPEDSRPHFRALYQLKEQLTRAGIPGLQYLSMGMSNDFEVAIEEGANFVRIGSAIFGERVYHAG